MRDGVSASRVAVGAGPWARVLDFLQARMPAVADWPERLQRGEVLDAQGRPVPPDAPATLGTVVGLLMGLVGVLFMPLVGAALGELWAQAQARRQLVASSTPATAVAPHGQDLQHDLRKALHVGVFAWLGMLAGLLAKVVLGCTMVGVFGAALAF